MSDKKRKADSMPPADSTKKDITEDDLHRYARDPESLGYGEASRQRQQEAAERYGTSDPFTIATSDISRFYRETTGKVLGPVQLRQLAKERLGQAGPTSLGRGATGASGGVSEEKVVEIVKKEVKEEVGNAVDNAFKKYLGRKEPEEPGYETEEPEEKKAPSPISKGNATKSKPEGKKPENYETKGKDEKAAEEPYDITGKEEVEWKDEKEEGDAKKEYESLRDVIEDMATNAGGEPTPKTKDAIARSGAAAKARNYKRAIDLLNIAEEDIVEQGMKQRASEPEEEYDDEFWKSSVGQMYKAAGEGKLPELLGRPVPEYSGYKLNSDRTKLILHGKAGDYTVSIDDGPVAEAAEEPGPTRKYRVNGVRWEELKKKSKKDPFAKMAVDNGLRTDEGGRWTRAKDKRYEITVPEEIALGLKLPGTHPLVQQIARGEKPAKIGKGTGKSKKEKQPESDEVTFEEIVEEKASEKPPEEDGTVVEEMEEMEAYDAKPKPGPPLKVPYFAPPPKPSPPPEKTEEEHAEPVEPPGPPDQVKSPDVVKLFECGNCGGTVEGEATECPECHAEFEKPEDHVEEPPVPEQHPERGTYKINESPGYGGDEVAELNLDYPGAKPDDMRQLAQELRERGTEVDSSGGLHGIKVIVTKENVDFIRNYLNVKGFNPAGIIDEEPVEEEEPSVEKIGPPPSPGRPKSPIKIVEFRPPTIPELPAEEEVDEVTEGDVTPDEIGAGDIDDDFAEAEGTGDEFAEINEEFAEVEGSVPPPGPPLTMQPQRPPEVPPPGPPEPAPRAQQAATKEPKADDDIDDLLKELEEPPAQALQGETEVGADKEPETVLQGVGLVPNDTPHVPEPTPEKGADTLGDMLKNLRRENGNTVAAGGTAQHPPTNVPPQEQPAEHGKTGDEIRKEAMRKAKEKAKKGT
jgi:hypothetical protein